jgi:hypothetical protein
MFKDYSTFESLNNYYSKSETIIVSNSKRAMFEILTAICILNPDFLTQILDGGYKQRYTMDTKSFMTDVKNIILNNNTKFKIGIWNKAEDKWETDKEISKIHYVFNDQTEFDVEKNWNVLVKADKLANSIRTALDIEDSKLKKVYWTGLDVFSEGCENVVVETKDEQFQICLKNIFGTGFTKNANDVLSDLFEADIDIYSEDYEDNWNILTNKWLNIVYEHSNLDFQKYILEWLHTSHIDNYTYEDYMKLKHPGKHNQKLGKHIPEFNKNITHLRDLLKEIYDNRQEIMEDVAAFDTKWANAKDEFLNSRVLEHLFIEQLKTMGNDGLYYMIDGVRYKTSTGSFKNNIIQFLLDKILCTGGKETYFFSENGKNWTFIPSSKVILEDDNVQALYRYHADLGDDNTDFELDVWIGRSEENKVQKMLLGKMHFNWFGEMANKLKCKLSFDYDIKEV